MTDKSIDYSAIERKIKFWAELQPDIQALFIVGSRGSNNQFQPGSDLDVLIITSKPKNYRIQRCWWREISPALVGQHQPGRRMIFARSDDYYVVFKPNMDVDFTIVSKNHLSQQIWLAKFYLRFPIFQNTNLEKILVSNAFAFRMGVRCLLDRNNWFNKIDATIAKILTCLNFYTQLE